MSFYPSRDFLLEVIKGSVAGYSYVERVGYLTNLTSSYKDVWQRDASFNWQTSAQSLEVVSSDVDDVDTTGTGARTLRVTGLNGSFAEVSETKALNGTTPVALTNTLIFPSLVEVLTAGSSETNEGDLDVRIASGGAILARVGAGDGISALSQYQIPNGKTGFLMGWGISGFESTLGTISAVLRVAEDGAPWKIVRRLHLASGSQEAKLGAADGFVLKLPSKARIGVRAKSGTDGAGISTHLSLVVV